MIVELSLTLDDTALSARPALSGSVESYLWI
jgi:hypothetical protein